MRRRAADQSRLCDREIDRVLDRQAVLRIITAQRQIGP